MTDVQIRYDTDGGGAEPEVVMTRHGDTYCIDHGYHPTLRAPGHEGYIFTILVGRQHRGDGLQAPDHFGGMGAVAHVVAEKGMRGHALLTGMRQAGVERMPVGMWHSLRVRVFTRIGRQPQAVHVR